MKYGTLDAQGRPVYAGTIFIDGKPVANPTREMYLANGQKPFLEEVNPPKSKSGTYYVQDGWVEQQLAIVPKWKLIKDQTQNIRIISKFALEGKLLEEGLLDQVDEIIDSQVITNDKGQTMPLRRRYETALEFSTGHKDFSRVFNLIKEELEISDEKAEEILVASLKKD
ncbi:MAG: hypothetical protein J6Q22_10940 [Prevotella sp.]|nr:hypothetical protein [Prevotella sp.]